MKKSKKISRILVSAVVLLSLILVTGLLPSSIYGNQAARRSWLMQFENGPVTINFVAAPPAKSRIVDARLISVESNGLVLRLSKDKDKFFPYANMISVDPK